MVGYINMSQSSISPIEGVNKGPIINENYMDQVRQTVMSREAESNKILELGEVAVLCFDKIKELKKMVDGKLYITNYRVRYKSLFTLSYLDLVY
jgi:hypothetical protein